MQSTCLKQCSLIDLLLQVHPQLLSAINRDPLQQEVGVQLAILQMRELLTLSG